MPVLLLRSFLFFLCLSLAAPAWAQLEISSPGASGEVFADIPDYATDVLDDPWDMSAISDTSNFILASDFNPGVSHYSQWDFSDGTASFNVIGPSGGAFYLLSPGPGPSHMEPTIGKNGQRR